jgi:hypothetical protein
LVDSGKPTSGKHRSAQCKRKRENRVLPLDHFQRDLQIAQERHADILNE